MIYRMLSCLAVLTLASSSYASEGERVRHYAFDAPTSKVQALELYFTTLGVIQHTLRASEPTNQQLEAVHEQSYALEEAVQYLSTQSYDEARVATLAEHVEYLHKASEDHQAASTKEHLSHVQSFDDFLLKE